MKRGGAVFEVREARPGDAPARAQLLHDAMLSLTGEVFCYFFFHEVTARLPGPPPRRPRGRGASGDLGVY